MFLPFKDKINDRIPDWELFVVLWDDWSHDSVSTHKSIQVKNAALLHFSTGPNRSSGVQLTQQIQSSFDPTRKLHLFLSHGLGNLCRV